MKGWSRAMGQAAQGLRRRHAGILQLSRFSMAVRWSCWVAGGAVGLWVLTQAVRGQSLSAQPVPAAAASSEPAPTEQPASATSASATSKSTAATNAAPPAQSAATLAATPTNVPLMQTLLEFRNFQSTQPGAECQLVATVQLTFAGAYWDCFFVQDERMAVMVMCEPEITVELNKCHAGTRLRIECFYDREIGFLRLKKYEVLDMNAPIEPLGQMVVDDSEDFPLNGYGRVSARVRELYLEPTEGAIYAGIGFVPAEFQFYCPVNAYELLPLWGVNVTIEGAICGQHRSGQVAQYLVRAMCKDQIHVDFAKYSHDYFRKGDYERNFFERLEGQVLYSDGRSQILMSTASGNVHVETQFALRLSGGDVVRVYCWKGSGEAKPSEVVQSCMVQLVERRDLPVAQPVALDDLAHLASLPQRAQVQGRVVDMQLGSQAYELQLAGEETVVTAIVPSPDDSLDATRFQKDDVVQIRGAVSRREGNSAGKQVKLTVFAAENADATIQRRPLRISPAMLSTGVLGALVSSVVVTSWIWSLNRQVRRRTSRLNEVASQLKVSLDSIQDAVLVFDAEGKVISWNQQLGAIFGTLPQLGSDVHEFWKLLDRRCPSLQEASELRARLVRNLNSQEQGSVKLVQPDQTVELYGRPVVDGSGHCYGTLWTFHDITKRQQLEADLLQSQKLEALGQLSGGVAHDFNNLLSVVRSSLYLMRSALLKGKPIDAHAVTAEMAVERAAELTKHLLEFSRRSTLSLQVVDVNAVVQQACELVRRVITADIELQVDVTKGPAFALVDPVRLEQVLINLGINARDALSQRGGIIRFATAERTEPNGPRSVVISVVDNGQGIPEKLRSKIYEPFFTTKPPGSGTGLGLSVALGVIQQMGGTLNHESTEGRGTTFSITLPLSDEAPPRLKPLRSTPGLNALSLRILLVDDEALARETARDVLDDLGHQVTTADGGEMAIKLLAAGNVFDVVLLDWSMPHISGQDVLNWIATTRPDLPVAICSGHADVLLGRVKADASPLRTVIQKPFSAEDLQAKLRSLWAEVLCS